MERPINDLEAKKLLCSNLDTLVKFFDEHGLRYCLSYGTLLGAVRHQGFIPWDDDVDVMMPRPDYNRFLDLTRQIKVNANLDVLYFPETAQYFWPFAKIVNTDTMLIEKQLRNDLQHWLKQYYGLYIDIFPIDGFPDNKDEQIRFFRRITSYMKGLQRSTYMARRVPSKPMTMLLRVIYKASELLGFRYYLKKLTQLAQTYPYDKQDFVGSCFGSYGIREVVKKEYFVDSVDVSFEGRAYSAPIGYHEYLASIYGDYMKLPPEEKRVSHHRRELYWRDHVS